MNQRDFNDKVLDLLEALSKIDPARNWADIERDQLAIREQIEHLRLFQPETPYED